MDPSRAHRQLKDCALRCDWSMVGNPSERVSAATIPTQAEIHFEPHVRHNALGSISRRQHSVRFALAKGKEAGVRAEPIGEHHETCEGVLKGR